MYQPRPTKLPALRLATSGLRLLPDFLIIGTQRGGSTSLYRYLSQHPWVAPAFRKEVHYFDFNTPRGLGWYRAHFPAAALRAGAACLGRRLVTGEGSPYYLPHPHAARRAAAAVPAAKVVALLRNPVARAYSHYQQVVRNGLESLSFEEAIAAEPERVNPELGRMLRDESYYSFAHHKHSYLGRGIYVDQIRTWREHFPEAQILVLRSEDFFKDTEGAMRTVTDFLGLPWRPLREYTKFNARSYDKMGEATRERLIAHFAPHNRRLAEYLGRDFGWD